MTSTIIERIAQVAADASFDTLPADVVHESKRILLDSIGCALAAVDEPKGKISHQFGQMLGAEGTDATIIGGTRRSSIFGAAFANAELINTLDYDIIMPPGHVTPYVVPVALAMGEKIGSSGKDLILATALSHEISYRFGQSMDYLRDTKDGKVNPPSIFGYSSTVFGATAAAGRLNGAPAEKIASALGIAAASLPVNAHWAWFNHTPSSTIKYQLAGSIPQAALTAWLLADLGHMGDLQMLDDRQFGFARIIGTSKWEPEHLTEDLGTLWRFPAHLSYKPYPHCRILHGLLGAMRKILTENAITPDEIEKITVFVEGFAEQPVWLNRTISHVQDGQFSVGHGIALGAHLVPSGRAWQDPDLVFSASVLNLMQKVEQKVHPDYVKLLTSNGASRPAYVEIIARGTTFKGEQRYPKGSATPDPDSYMTDAELVDKFLENASAVLAADVAQSVAQRFLSLEQEVDIRPVMQALVAPARVRAVAASAA